TILKAAIDNSSAGIAIADAPDGTLRYVNDAGLLIRGGTRDTVVNGIGIDKYVASWKLFDFDGRPLDPDEVPLARAIKFGETNSRSFFIRRIEGDDRAVVANASPIRDVEGNIVAAIVVFQDITEQKKAEERMRSSEERLTLATEAGNIGIWDWNVQNDILVWDDSMYRLYGVRKEEFGGVYEAWSRTVLPEDRTYADGEIQAAIRGEREYDIEHRIVRPDGTVRVIAVSAKILRGKDGKAKRMIGTNIDITDRKEAETRIVKLLSEKETLLREVHHRMKNNMNTIQSLLALQAEFAHDPTVAAALDDARNRLRSMEILYDKLYRVERYDAISANDYLPALVKEIVSVFPNSDLVEVTTEVGDFMLAPRQMTAVGILVNEIVTNSMKYAFRSRGGGCIFLTAALTERRVRIAIRDDGVGFPSDVDIGNSKGFGMTLVGGLAKQLGGSIRIERGQGTTFVLEFEAEKV
ncbi:MAG: PAS domain-containing protein, partial [Spirochaetota bacterium]